jgi:hypothetical protein
LTLVRGSRLVEGISVGYPHTLAGAVSAAVEYTAQAGSTLEPGRGVVIGRVAVDPSWSNFAAEFAEGRKQTRTSMGLPPDGPLPADTGMAVSPVAYQVRDGSDDRVTVLLLGYLTTTSQQAGVQTRIGVFPLLMRWAGGDWKAAQRDDDNDYAHLRLEPGTPAATAAGWQELRR